MRILDGLAGLRQVPPGSVLSIGNFDGIHRGHQQILEVCRRLRGPAGRTAIVTFEPHPLTVLRPELAPPRLTSAADKRDLLAAAGVDDFVILPPTREVLDLSAEDFWKILRDEVRAAHLVEGATFTFGKGRGGTIQRLREWTASSSVQLHLVDPVEVALLDLSIVNVSSSIVRWLVGYGRVRDAAICLGHPYALHGEVVRGHQRGRTIGIPTANLRITDQLIPADGVYTGRCSINGQTHPAAVSIGTLPTFGDNARQVEAHLINFDGDLYGQVVQVELIDWLRDQLKFKGIEALKAQIGRDLVAVSRDVNRDPTRALASLTI